MNLLFNGVGFAYLILLLPLHLSNSSDPIGVALNAISAYFVVELDNNNESRILRLCDIRNVQNTLSLTGLENAMSRFSTNYTRKRRQNDDRQTAGD